MVLVILLRTNVTRTIVTLFLDTVSQKLKNNNVFTIAKRNVDGQDMLYMSLKLTNGIWVLAELKISPTSSDFKVRVRVVHCVLILKLQ